MIEYWTVEIPEEKPAPPAFLEMACMQASPKKNLLLFRDRFNALKLAQVLGSKAQPCPRGQQ